ncbi:MAG TPA: HAD-IA family hydrolase [Burkholderiaceae bacterium]|jgi:phosphoglycolate phosphatase|nr:HAD-IA family hydrolase [Burkholderiaceae bacterium]
MLERFDTIVFDWDGTLIDSTGMIASAIRSAAADLGLPDPGPERASSVIGLGLMQALAIAVPELPAERAAEFAARYRVHFVAGETRLQLFPNARELLAQLRARRRGLAIATGKTRAGLSRALDSLGLATQFDASRCADETEPKPHPKMLLELADELRTRPARMLMVGDTTHDLQMAAAAGVAAVAVTHGAHPASALQQSAALVVVDSLVELQRWLIPA